MFDNNKICKAKLQNFIKKNFWGNITRQISDNQTIYSVNQQTDFIAIFNDEVELGQWICLNFNQYKKLSTKIIQNLLEEHLTENHPTSQ